MNPRQLFSSILFLLCLLGITPVSAQQKQVLLHTTEGDIRIALYDDTPIHRDNFLKLVSEHFYDSLLFHRVIKSFMIQTGDPQSRHAEPGATLGEGRRGAVAMAREGDKSNPERRSSGCQFYIVWGKNYSTKELETIQQKVLDATDGKTTMSSEMFWDYKKTGGSPHLDGQYTVFGEVVEGLDVVERIQKVYTDDYDRPVEDVRILSTQIY